MRVVEKASSVIIVSFQNCHSNILMFCISGKNSGKGYYIYEKGSQPEPDLSVQPVIEDSRKLTNIGANAKVFYPFKA